MATVETKRCMMITNCCGNRVCAGILADDAVVPEILAEGVGSTPMLNMGNSTFYFLAQVEVLQILDNATLDSLAAGALRRATVGKLSDAELAVLGVVRDI